MHVDVVASVNELTQEEVLFKTVIVVDTLRATSTVVTGLACGAIQVIPAETIGQAKSWAAKHPSYWLAGERNGKKISGFHLGNSPSEWLTAPVAGKHIIFTTTNGTRAIIKAGKADHLLLGSLLNGQACAQQAAAYQADITILCAGHRNQFALEDGLTAGHLIHWLGQYHESITLNDFGRALYQAYRASVPQLDTVIAAGQTGRRLIQLGYQNDLAFCCQLDKFSVTALFSPPGIVALPDASGTTISPPADIQ